MYVWREKEMLHFSIYLIEAGGTYETRHKRIGAVLTDGWLTC